MPKSPVPQATIDTLIAAQRILMETIPLVQHLEACGRDCSDYKAKAEQTMDQLVKLVEAFKPGGKYESGSI